MDKKSEQGPKEKKIDHASVKQDYLIPDEPIRFSLEDFERLLSFCHELNASDITIQTNEVIFAEIYGRLAPITKRPITNTEVGDLLNKIYGPNGTTQILTGNDVDTYYEFKPNRFDRHRFRVNGTGCQVEGHDGIQLTLRTIPTTPPLLETMALPEDVLKALTPDEGTVYVTGATGSGKSTLLASIIRHIAENPDSHRKILTYEAPIEFVYDELTTPSALISQSEIPRHLPSFAAGVRNALRRKPRLILVGEARDEETIEAVIEACLTGHPVYTTLHSNGVSQTIRRLVNSFSKEEQHARTTDIIETLRLIIWQKLVPTVDGKRVALREYLIFDETIRDKLLATHPDKVTAKTRELLKNYGQPMVVDAKEKYAAGKISKRDYMLITKSNSDTEHDTTL